MAEHNEDAAFTFEPTLEVTNSACNMRVSIMAKFLKKVDDREFILLDFYKSRGVYNMMSCRVLLADKTINKGSRSSNMYRTLKTVCKKIRGLRDAAIKRTIHSNDVKKPRSSELRRPHSIMPVLAKHRATALALDDCITFDLPAVPDVADQATCTATVELNRKNQNNQLWVAAESQVFDYISKIVLHEWQTHGDRTDTHDDEVDANGSDVADDDGSMGGA